MFFQLFAPKARHATLVAAAILIGGLAATAAVRALTEHMLVTETQRRFTADAADITTAIGERLRTHAEVLVSMQGLYASLGRVDRAQFRRYLDVLDVSRRYPGFQALQSLRHVKASDLESFVAEMRADAGMAPDGHGEFAVRPPGARPSYNVIEFVEPMRGNEDSLGFDAGSNPAQLDSLRRAAETGRIVATPPVKLVQDNSGGLGFILRAPIYRAGEPAQTTSQRVAALRGFVASVYRMNDLMRGVLDPRTLQQMHVTVIDRGYAKPTADGVMSAEPEVIDAATLMYDSLEPNLSLVAPAATSALGVSADRALVVGDRVWRVTFDARVGSSYAIDRALPNFVLVSGVIITLLIALLTAIIMRSRQLSGSLSALDAEQRALVDNPLAGILFTDGRRILRGNRRIAELTGREADALPGSTIDQLLAERSRPRGVRHRAGADWAKRARDGSRAASAPPRRRDAAGQRLRQAARAGRDSLGGSGQNRRTPDGGRAPRSRARDAGDERPADCLARGGGNTRPGNHVAGRAERNAAILPVAQRDLRRDPDLCDPSVSA